MRHKRLKENRKTERESRGQKNGNNVIIMKKK